MKFRILIVALLAMASFGVRAQSLAAQVKEIQLDTNTYINAESTAIDENEAYADALRQIIDMAKNFVEANTNGMQVSDDAIESMTKKIVMPRGDSKRVFLYVRRSDLTGDTAPTKDEKGNGSGVQTVNEKTNVATNGNAGTDAKSVAAQIKSIQKDTNTYINAESTDPDEDAAYDKALDQIVDMAKNYVDTNNNGAQVDRDDIESVTNKIVTVRGAFKRVFLYVKRSDLIDKSNQEKPIVIVDVIDEPTDVLTDEEFENEAVAEIVEEVQVKSSNLPKATTELIERLQNCKSLQQATSVLNEAKSRHQISDFGVARQAKNTLSSYWVVESDGKVSVLGPEIKGMRMNYRTGKADALYRYSRGLWFRRNR